MDGIAALTSGGQLMEEIVDQGRHPLKSGRLGSGGGIPTSQLGTPSDAPASAEPAEADPNSDDKASGDD
jgi:hypothetical protein